MKNELSKARLTLQFPIILAYFLFPMYKLANRYNKNKVIRQICSIVLWINLSYLRVAYIRNNKRILLLGNRIRELRNQKGLTTAEWAHIADISFS